MVSDTAIASEISISGKRLCAEYKVGDTVIVRSMGIKGVVCKVESDIVWCRIPVYPGEIGLTRRDSVVQAREGGDVREWSPFLTADSLSREEDKH